MKKLIIAGNAPSLKEIDYQRLPDEYDVFRCNQFYFEDKYYLGKNFKAVFYNPYVFFEQYYTLKHLMAKEEYQSELIVYSNFNLPYLENPDLFKNFHSYFPDASLGYDFFKQLKDFDAYFKFNEIYLDQRITSGIYMCVVGIALGYKQIYLAGIDFYQQGGYAFDTKQKNLLKLEPNFKNDNSQYARHSQNTEIQALEFLKKHYGVEFYCLCPSSPLKDFIPLAPLSHSHFVPEEKKNYTQDILLPPKEAYKKIMGVKEANLKKNFYFKAIKDLLRLPSDIKHYFKGKRQ